VHETSDHEVQPVARCEALPEEAPPQDVLTDEAHEERMLEIVVEGVGLGDALDRQPSGPLENFRQ
jgi:hypothetical protein